MTRPPGYPGDMMGAEIIGSDLWVLLAEQSQPGSVVVPWWLRFGVIVYGALLVAALMIYAQTKHQRPWSVLWVLIIAFVPILGAISYFIAQGVLYRRSGQRPTKGRAETMAPEEYQDQARDEDPGPPRPDTGSTPPHAERRHPEGGS